MQIKNIIRGTSGTYSHQSEKSSVHKLSSVNKQHINIYM